MLSCPPKEKARNEHRKLCATSLNGARLIPLCNVLEVWYCNLSYCLGKKLAPRLRVCQRLLPMRLPLPTLTNPHDPPHPTPHPPSSLSTPLHLLIRERCYLPPDPLPSPSSSSSSLSLSHSLFFITQILPGAAFFPIVCMRAKSLLQESLLSGLSRLQKGRLGTIDDRALKNFRWRKVKSSQSPSTPQLRIISNQQKLVYSTISSFPRKLG